MTKPRITRLRVAWVVYFVCIAFSIYLHIPSSRVIAQWKQPLEVKYGSFEPYALSVVDRGMDPSSLFQKHSYELFVGRGTDAPAYGHYVRWSFNPRDDDPDAYIQKSTVRWTTEGVSLTEPSGHQVFIPTAAFIGGR